MSFSQLPIFLTSRSVHILRVMALPALTVFDIETTGLDPKRGHRIIEIAGVRVENGVIHKDTAFCSYVNPERDIPPEARQIHKITDEDVKNAPTIMEVLPSFLQFAQGSMLVAHNAEFDMGFLRNEKEFCWGYVDLPECFCTMRMSQSVFPRELRHNLDMLCQRLAIPVPPGRHRALTDVLLTAEALLRMAKQGAVSSLDDIRKRAALAQLVAR